MRSDSFWVKVLKGNSCPGVSFCKLPLGRTEIFEPTGRCKRQLQVEVGKVSVAAAVGRNGLRESSSEK